MDSSVASLQAIAFSFFIGILLIIYFSTRKPQTQSNALQKTVATKGTAFLTDLYPPAPAVQDAVDAVGEFPAAQPASASPPPSLPSVTTLLLANAEKDALLQSAKKIAQRTLEEEEAFWTDLRARELRHMKMRSEIELLRSELRSLHSAAVASVVTSSPSLAYSEARAAATAAENILQSAATKLDSQLPIEPAAARHLSRTEHVGSAFTLRQQHLEGADDTAYLHAPLPTEGFSESDEDDDTDDCDDETERGAVPQQTFPSSSAAARSGLRTHAAAAAATATADENNRFIRNAPAPVSVPSTSGASPRSRSRSVWDQLHLTRHVASVTKVTPVLGSGGTGLLDPSSPSGVRRGPSGSFMSSSAVGVSPASGRILSGTTASLSSASSHSPRRDRPPEKLVQEDIERFKARQSSGGSRLKADGQATPSSPHVDFEKPDRLSPLRSSMLADRRQSMLMTQWASSLRSGAVVVAEAGTVALSPTADGGSVGRGNSLVSLRSKDELEEDIKNHKENRRRTEIETFRKLREERRLAKQREEELVEEGTKIAILTAMQSNGDEFVMLSPLAASLSVGEPHQSADRERRSHSAGPTARSQLTSVQRLSRLPAHRIPRQMKGISGGGRRERDVSPGVSWRGFSDSSPSAAASAPVPKSPPKGPLFRIPGMMGFFGSDGFSLVEQPSERWSVATSLKSLIRRSEPASERLRKTLSRALTTLDYARHDLQPLPDVGHSATGAAASAAGTAGVGFSSPSTTSSSSSSSSSAADLALAAGIVSYGQRLAFHVNKPFDLPLDRANPRKEARRTASAAPAPSSSPASGKKEWVGATRLGSPSSRRLL